MCFFMQKSSYELRISDRSSDVCSSDHGGGADLTPTTTDEADRRDFHAALQAACDAHDPGCYARFRDWCDEYFFIKHRNEPRGVGGIFFDNLEGDWDSRFAFTQDVGRAFLEIGRAPA